MKTKLTPEQYILQLQESIAVKEIMLTRQDDKINKYEEKIARQAALLNQQQEQITALEAQVQALGGRHG